MSELKRALGLPLLLFYGLGNILGAGIYVLIGKVGGAAGPWMPLSFLVASGIAAFSALAYAELSARYPYSAGEAVYVQEGFQVTALSRLVGLLIALAGMVSAATIARGFHGYFSTFIALPEPLVISGIVLLLGLLAIWGITQSAGMAALLTLVEIGGLLLVIAAGRHLLQMPLPSSGDLLPLRDMAIWPGILSGAFLAFYAFIGFEDMVNVAEEVRDPHHTLPRAILLALLIATVMYLLVAVVALRALPPALLQDSDAPLADILVALSADVDTAVISLISMLAIINGALIQIIMAARICYGMAGRGWLPAALAQVSARTQTPVRATVLVTALILLLALQVPLESLARSTSALVLLVFALVNAALLRIKRKQPPLPGILNLPAWVPACGLLSALALLLYQGWLLIRL